MMLHISELHIGEQATFANAQRAVTLLQAEGWPVAYGESPWRFDDEAKRPLFEQAFAWAWAVVQAEERPFDEAVMVALAKQRFQQNAMLKPYESQLLGKQAMWAGYLTWLLETPAAKIVMMLKPDETKSVSKK